MRYSPWDLLPCKHAKEEEFKNTPDFFYENVIRHLIADVVRVMNNGIPINLERVSQLEDTVDSVLLDVEFKIANSPIMKDFLSAKYEHLRDKKHDEFNDKKKDYTHFIKPFKFTDKLHRKYLINQYLESINKLEGYQLDEWSIKDVKQLNLTNPSVLLDKLLDKTLPTSHKLVLAAMEQLARDKSTIYNKKYDDKFDNLTESDLLEPFNCGSSTQLREFFTYLEIESNSTSRKTGNPSYNRKELERILTEITLTLERYTDDV